MLINRDITTNGVTEIHCAFSQYSKELLPGLYMNADIETVSSPRQFTSGAQHREF